MTGSAGSLVTRIPDEPVRFRAEQDLPRVSRLLQPCGHVDGVAADESLPGPGVTGDDLAGVDACAPLD